MRLEELSPDLLATIAARLSFAELVLLGGTCSKIRQSTVAVLESKRRDYLLPRRVADALVDAMDAHLRLVFNRDDVLRLVRVDNVASWHNVRGGGDIASVGYLLRNGTVNCLFPTRMSRQCMVEKEFCASVASESSGLITYYLDGSVRPEDLQEFRMMHGHDPPAQPIAYNDGLFAFVVAEGLGSLL